MATLSAVPDAPDDGDGASGRAAGRPIIAVTADIHLAVSASCEALSRDDGLYQRDGSLARLVRVAEPDELQAVGTPQIRSVSIATLRERLTRLASYVVCNAKGDWVPKAPGSDVVLAVADRAEWPGVRPIVGIAEAPIVRPDGGIVTTAGYDHATGYVYQPNCELPKLSECPTQPQAAKALAYIAALFAEFPMRSESDRYVPIAALLTMLARPAIRGAVPGFVFDASTPGSGKSMLCDVVTMIAMGRKAARLNWTDDEEEVEKNLGALALRGAGVVVFDNIAKPFGGAPIERALTATDKVAFRILGRSEVPELRWRAVVLGSGNNVAISGDTPRRLLVARIEPNVENPEERTFNITDLVAHAEANRPMLLAAALTILRSWHCAGRPCEHHPWGGFEAWTRIVPAALTYAGAPNVMLSRPSLDAAAATAAQQLGTLLAGVFKLAEGLPVSARAIVDALYPDGKAPRGDMPPDGQDDTREILETAIGRGIRPGTAPTPSQVGNVLRKHRGRVSQGHRLVCQTGGGGAMRWTVEKV